MESVATPTPPAVIAPPRGGRWSLEDIPFASIDRRRMVDDEWFFFLLATASFIESASDLYTRNLVAYYAGDADTVAWLSGQWEPEELRHGAALRRYVETVWPDFDWQQGFDGFLADYSDYCRVELLGPTKALELASRCVVETGTATYYTMLSSASPEPVIRWLTWLIRNDEVRHYSHFYRYFRVYRERERPARRSVARTLWARARETSNEDALCAFRQAYRVRHPKRPFEESIYRDWEKRVYRAARQHYPYRMAVKMFLRPLGLGPRTQRLAVPLLASGMRLAL